MMILKLHNQSGQIIEKVVSDIPLNRKIILDDQKKMSDFLDDLERRIDSGNIELEPAYNACLQAMTTVRFLQSHFVASMEVS